MASIRSGKSEGLQMWHMKNMVPWAYKIVMRSVLVAGAALLATVALAPTASAQIVIGIDPPVCSYGYYDYQPYACAPMGFYGPGYFFNGIFLGVGPWGNWGYSHGWGGHRFNGGGGGRYGGGRGIAGGHGGAGLVRASHSGGGQRGGSFGGAHASAARSGGGGSRGGGASRGGGGSHGGGGSRGGGSGSHGGGGGRR
jgi:hypothetical protein